MTDQHDIAAADLIPASSQTNLKKRHMLVTSGFVIAAILLVTILVIGLKVDISKVPGAQLDKPAKDFHVAWLQGQEFAPNAAADRFNLQDFHGKPLVLNFWASWCVSCREEALEFQRFWSIHQADVAVVGIAIQDESEAALKFARYYGKTYMLGLDEDGKAAIDYGVTGVPETFLIDRNGIIRHKETGPVNAAQLESLLAKIM